MTEGIYVMIGPSDGIIGKTITFTDKVRYNVTILNGKANEEILIYINKEDVEKWNTKYQLRDNFNKRELYSQIKVLKARFI